MQALSHMCVSNDEAAAANAIRFKRNGLCEDFMISNLQVCGSSVEKVSNESTTAQCVDGGMIAMSSPCDNHMV